MTTPDIPDMCPCPDPLINEWLNRCGEVIESRPLAGDTDARSAAARDAVDFMLDPSAVGWRIVCPDCRRIYAEMLVEF